MRMIVISVLGIYFALPLRPLFHCCQPSSLPLLRWTYFKDLLHIEECFLSQCPRNVKECISKTSDAIAKAPNYLQLCHLHSHWLGIRHWLMILSYMPTSRDWGRCSLCLADSRRLHCFSSLLTKKIKMLLPCIFNMHPGLLIKANIFAGLMTILTSFLKYLCMSCAHFFSLRFTCMKILILHHIFPSLPAIWLTVNFESQFSFLSHRI